MQTGDYVVHRSGMVCRIESIENLNLTGTETSYVVLSPVRNSMEKIYVPESKANKQLRPAMSREEALSLLDRFKDIEPLTIRNEKQREQEYKDAFDVHSYDSIVSIAKELYRRKQYRTKIGKKLPVRDEQMMMTVKTTLTEAFAVALDAKPEKVQDLLLENIKQS